MSSFDGRVNVTGYRYFYLIEDEIEFANAPLPDKSQSNGVVSPTVHGAVITSGIADGPVLVTVDVLNRPPATVETERWEEIVEIAVETSTGRLWFGSFDEGAGTGPPVVLAEKAPHRLRVHCRGRDINRGLVVDQPSETYYLQLWPGTDIDATEWKHSDRIGLAAQNRRLRIRDSKVP